MISWAEFGELRSAIHNEDWDRLSSLRVEPNLDLVYYMRQLPPEKLARATRWHARREVAQRQGRLRKCELAAWLEPNEIALAVAGVTLERMSVGVYERLVLAWSSTPARRVLKHWEVWAAQNPYPLVGCGMDEHSITQLEAHPRHTHEHWLSAPRKALDAHERWVRFPNDLELIEEIRSWAKLLDMMCRVVYSNSIEQPGPEAVPGALASEVLQVIRAVLFPWHADSQIRAIEERVWWSMSYSCLVLELEQSPPALGVCSLGGDGWLLGSRKDWGRSPLENRSMGVMDTQWTRKYKEKHLKMWAHCFDQFVLNKHRVLAAQIAPEQKPIHCLGNRVHL